MPKQWTKKYVALSRSGKYKQFSKINMAKLFVKKRRWKGAAIFKRR